MKARADSIRPELNIVDARQFETMVRSHEAFTAGRRGGARIMPRFIVAEAMRCDRRKLQDADFTGANLSGSTFVATDLSRASLYCANVSRCDFRGSKLVRADLRGSTFTGAKLAGACLDGADMRAARLCTLDEEGGLQHPEPAAEFAGARMNGVNLNDAVAHSVDFSNCSFRGATMRNANLRHAIFVGANLDGVDFRGARLAGATFQGAILTGVNTDHLAVPLSALAGCVLDPDEAALARVGEIRAQLEQSDTWIRTDGAGGAPAMLDGFDLRPAQALLSGRKLAGASARNVVAVHMDLSGVLCPGANFDGADLRGVNFSNADLRGASFLGAKLGHATLKGADLSALPLEGGRSRCVRFDGADLTGTGITWSAPPAAA
jgi:uncharacterized protein YjbI with pentapeptide repeats